jgi:hypothetical protein
LGEPVGGHEDSGDRALSLVWGPAVPMIYGMPWRETIEPSDRDKLVALEMLHSPDLTIGPHMVWTKTTTISRGAEGAADALHRYQTSLRAVDTAIASDPTQIEAPQRAHPPTAW